MRIACIVAAALSLAPGAQAQIYKWVDEKGQTHYEERPPEGKDQKDAKKMTAPAMSKDAPKAAAGTDLKQNEIEFKQRQQLRDQSYAAEEKKRAQREKACQDAREDLDYNDKRGRFYTEEKGEKRFRTDEEQAAVVAAARRKVQELCQ